ncbi:MAG TPA: hypothetical protein VMS14_05565 [Ilumatobacteraceae bacterium]|nr:hypothetical protein [Ilumatobacteraceae bacterium]
MTSTPRTRLAIAALAIAALGLAACGSDDDGGGAPFGGGGEEDDGDDGSGEETPDETTDDGGEAPDTTPEDDGGDDGGSNDLGFCNVKVTGDVESEWTTPGGGITAAYGLWFPESMRDPSTPPENYFVINCTGEGSDYVGFVATGDGPGVPMQAATYTLPEGTGGLAAGPDDPVDVIIGLNGPNNMSVWDTGPGATLVITEFDENHIAGTFTIPVIDNNAGTGTATITGEFDLANSYA